MEDFLVSDEFKTYRELLINTISKYISGRLFSKDDADIREVIGAIGLGKLIIKLPLEIRNNEFVCNMINDDLNRFEKKVVRKGLE